MSGIIETAGAIVNQNFTLIKNHGKYLVADTVLSRYLQDRKHDTEFVKLLYRRFVRLAPFVSNLRVGRETYIDYVKYKFKYEDYELKRKLVLGEGSYCDSCDHWKLETLNTLKFIIRAVSYVEGGSKTKSKRVANESRIARIILRNLLTVEHDKINGHVSPSSRDTAFYEYRIAFDHLKTGGIPISSLKRGENSRENGTKGNMMKKKKGADFVRYKAISSFDRCIVYLNESLNTRL